MPDNLSSQLPHTYPTLMVYRASAGSGKTFTLAITYIKLLIQNPNSYRNILAVTFTNKATEEMKMRILGQLYGISKGLPDSRFYLSRIEKDLQLSEAVIREKAGIALKNLIHHYHFFNVQTIDAFFQSVLRNLARELDLSPNLRVGLNDLQVEQLAVDEFVEELQVGSEPLKWIFNYLKENLEEEKSWNVVGQLKNFGVNIFKDIYKKHSKALQQLVNNPQQFDQIAQVLKHIYDRKGKELETLSQSVCNQFDQLKLDPATDFKYGKSGIGGYFIKLQRKEYNAGKLLTNRVKAVFEEKEGWFSPKTLDASPHLKDLEPTLNHLLHNTEQQRKILYRDWATSKLMLLHLSKMRLLSSIEHKVHQINRDTNRFMLSNTQTVLSGMINESDAPFIFEKIGTRISHIMIDEFQDTAVVQWDNFKVLLKECMSLKDTTNLIVGDVKQSIYRWRSGDWRLLNNITAHFKDQESLVREQSMQVNYRSNRRIVMFNNAFFTCAVQQEADNLSKKEIKQSRILVDAYKDVAQEIPSNKPDIGFVSITILEDDDKKQEQLRLVKDQLQSLLSQQIQPKDIAILVRGNNDIALLADYLTKNLPDVSIVSDEAFRLAASSAVNFIVDALYVLHNPEDILHKASLVKAYQLQQHLQERDGITQCIRADLLDQSLPDDFVGEQRKKLITMPLLDLIETICNLFEVYHDSSQSAYICTFYDKVVELLNDSSLDLGGLLSAWEEDLKNISIQSNEVEGVRLLTIHKSKGLEYEHVIVPFCDWGLENPTSILWCEPQEDPYCRVPLIPVRFSGSTLVGTIFENDYQEEVLQNRVDNLNLLYVAFTRACTGLYVYGKYQSSGRSHLIQQCLSDVAKNLGSAVYTEEGKHGCTFTYGQEDWKHDTGAKQKVSENVFLQDPTSIDVTITSSQTPISFVQSNQSRDFVGSQSVSDTQEYLMLGKIYHYILSKIQTADEIESVLNRLEQEGIVTEQKQRKKIVDLFTSGMKHPQVAEWFTADWKIHNECAILIVDKDGGNVVERRPDRVISNQDKIVVIDFKFGKRHEEHQEQVKNYIRLLQQMYDRPVEGYLWYVYRNQVVPVKP